MIYRYWKVNESKTFIRYFVSKKNWFVIYELFQMISLLLVYEKNDFVLN